MSDHYEIIRQSLWRDYRFLRMEIEQRYLYLKLRTGTDRITRGLAFAPGNRLNIDRELARWVEGGYYVLPDALRDDPPANPDHCTKMIRDAFHPSVPRAASEIWFDALREAAADRVIAALDRHPDLADTVLHTVGDTLGGHDTDTDTDTVGNPVATEVTTALQASSNGALKREQEKLDFIAQWETGLAKALAEASPQAQAWITQGLLPEFLQVLTNRYVAMNQEFTITRKAAFAKRMKQYDALIQATAMEIYVDLDGGQKWEYVCGIAKRLHDEERLEKKTVKAALTFHRNHHKQGVYARWMQEAR